VSCNFGLISNLRWQITLPLRGRVILLSRVWYHTKLHSTQFTPLNYHYLSSKFSWGCDPNPKAKIIKYMLIPGRSCLVVFWIFTTRNKIMLLHLSKINNSLSLPYLNLDLFLSLIKYVLIWLWVFYFYNMFIFRLEVFLRL